MIISISVLVRDSASINGQRQRGLCEIVLFLADHFETQAHMPERASQCVIT